MAKRKCPNGHVVKDKRALKCPQCGADLPPVPKRKRIGLFIVGGLLLVIILAVALSGGDDDGATRTADLPKPTATIVPSLASQEPIAPPASTDAPPPTKVPTATHEVRELHLGDVVELDGYALCAVSVADPATPGMFYTAETGKKLVGVELILANLTGETLSVNSLYATLLDADGFSYEAELGGIDGQIATITLSVGEKARGWVSFTVPQAASPAAVKYSLEVFGSKAIRASLVPGPDGYTPDQAALAVLPPVPVAGVGETAEEYGFTLSASGVENPTDPGMFYTKVAGYKAVAVEITVGNVSGESLSANALYTVLVDDQGYVYAPDLGGRDGQLDTLDLAPGEKAKGWVTFTIPEGATPTTVKYLVEVFSDKYLTVGLVR